MAEHAADAERGLEGTLDAATLAGVLGHELRSPLSSIKAWGELLLQNPSDAELVKEAARVIDRNAALLARIVENLVGASRSSGARALARSGSVRLHDLLEGVLQSVRPSFAAREVALVYQEPPVAPVVRGDAALLQQVFLNLLSNARDFTPSGGSVTISCTTDPARAVVTMTDTGVGISPEDARRATLPFWQKQRDRSRAGLGLGLAVVSDLVAAHDGKFTLRSNAPAPGASAVVELPLRVHASLNDDADEAPSSRRKLEPIHGRILVVDDDDDLRDVMTQLLRVHGLESMSACSATEALRIARQLPFAAIICDIAMPLHDGFWFIDQLMREQAGPAPPVIALTGHTPPDAARRIRAAGFDRYLVKPVDTQTLIEHLRAVIGSRAR